MSTRKRTEQRQQLLADLHAAGREHSTVTVLFHAVLAGRLGLGPTDEKILDFLERDGRLTAGELVRRTGLAPSSITAALDRLEDAGFVRRQRDPHDRRRVVVEFRTERLADALPLFKGLTQRLNELYADYDDDELAIILDFMRRAAVLQRDAADELSQQG